MSTTISVQAGETGVIRVFAVNLAPAEMRSLLDKQPKSDVARALLNGPHLDTGNVEIFPVSDLAGVGLASYLAEGYTVSDASLQADKAKLDALDGYVLLLFSDAFGGLATELAPGPDITLIGSYREFQPDQTAGPISSQSAAPYTGAQPEPLPPQRARASGSFLVVAALLAALLALVWWALS